MSRTDALAVEGAVTTHYGGGDLCSRILQALATAGRSSERIDPEDLRPVDEFHIGGAEATEALIASLAIGPESRVLDIGAGIGGTARSVALATGAAVVGIDSNESFVATAEELSRRAGVEGVTFVHGSATDLPFAAASFDLALMLHVGMNLPDKPKLFAEVARVLAPGGTFAVYDIMQAGDGKVTYPTPWASGPEVSFLAAPAAYATAAHEAGFTEVGRRDRSAFAVAFFDRLQARLAASGPPPLGLHLVMGAEAPIRYGNMVEAVRAGRLAPVEMVFRRG